MKLIEAKKLCKKRNILAFVLAIAGVLGLIVAAMKGIYVLPWDQDDLSSLFANPIKGFITWVYEHTQLISFIWKIAPTPDIINWNTTENYFFAFLFCAIGIARVLFDSSRHLASRIKKTIEAAEEEIWKRGLLQESGYLELKPDLLSLEIKLEQKDKWHTRPEGVILITIIAAFPSLNYMLVPA